MKNNKSTWEICKNAGLTYNGFTIGLPEEYYRENYRKECLKDEIDKEFRKIVADENKSKADELAIKLISKFKL